MRIAIIKSNYTPYGGGEKYATRLINAFVARNVHVDVLTAVRGQWEGASQNVRWVTMRQSKYNNLLRLLTFNSSVACYLSQVKYDCIFGMDRTENQTHLRAGGGCHASWIRRRCAESSKFRCYSFKVNPFHRVMKKMERRAFFSNELKRIFCNSYLVRDEILYYYPLIEQKLTVVHNGVEWFEFSEPFEKGMAERDNILRILSLHGDKYYFLFVGSGYERKGLGKAIAALRLLPDYVELIIVGKDKHEKKYKYLSEKLGVRSRVHFFGPQKNVIHFLQVADAFILPTIYDPFSNASIEALAMGLYTVTSDANGCSEVIKEGTGHIISDLRDINSVTEGMRASLRKHLSKEEIRGTVKYLNFDKQLKKVVDICLSDSPQDYL